MVELVERWLAAFLQGSVLGPLLWNVAYNWVIRDANFPRVTTATRPSDHSRGRAYRFRGSDEVPGHHSGQSIGVYGLISRRWSPNYWEDFGLFSGRKTW